MNSNTIITNKSKQQIIGTSSGSSLITINSSTSSQLSTQNSTILTTSGSTTTTTTTTTSSSSASSSQSSNYGGFAYCANCGDYGVKAAFYGKSKLYCSVVCQSGIKKTIQQQQNNSNKRTYDSISLNDSTNEKSTIVLPPTPTTPNVKIQKLNHNTNTTINNTANSTTTSINSINNQITQLPTPTTPNNSFLNSINTPHQTAPVVGKSPSTQAASSSFSWPFYLEYDCENAEAAPVYAFKHVPLNDFWNKIHKTCGIKVEVPNRDFSSVDEKFNYWFATVVKFAGYLAKLRYVGYEDTDTHDFWIHLCDTHIQPVGWAAENDIPLIPPNNLTDKVDDWKQYLIENLTGCKTLPKNFHRRVKESLKSRFRRGMLLEIVDKKKLSRMKVSRIIDNIGGRIRMKYENCEDFDDFWCHQNSELVHPIGWSVFNGHDIDSSEEYKRSSLEKILNNTYESNECSPNMFKKPRDLPVDKINKHFKVNMKLEAIDPLNLSAICVATVGKVLKNNYLMIRIDGCKAEDGSDMFCYNRTSSSIFPAGFCQINNIPLQAPYDYKGEFNWDTYLQQTNSEFAPTELFYSDDSFVNPFKKGMKLESVDLMEPKMICVATVVAVIDRLIRLNFDGWDPEYDQWVDCESCDIYPVGWCQLVGYQLEPPRKTDLDSSLSKKKSKKSKRYSKK